MHKNSWQMADPVHLRRWQLSFWLSVIRNNSLLKNNLSSPTERIENTQGMLCGTPTAVGNNRMQCIVLSVQSEWHTQNRFYCIMCVLAKIHVYFISIFPLLRVCPFLKCVCTHSKSSGRAVQNEWIFGEWKCVLVLTARPSALWFCHFHTSSVLISKPADLLQNTKCITIN